MVGTSPHQAILQFDNKSAFLSIRTDTELALYLDIDLNKLNYLLYKATDKYIQFEIPKKNGGTRKIQSPSSLLKKLQNKIKAALVEIYAPTKAAHGYLSNRSIVTNAEKHANKAYLLNVDLKDFFPSINFGRVYGLFKAYPFNFPEKVATKVAQICTHENQLPQGAPTSPILSNMICRRMDKDLEKFCKKLKVRYTRYADDLSFSWDASAACEELLESKIGAPIVGIQLREIIKKNGFEINQQKIHVSTHLDRQVVTGIKVNNKTLNLRRLFPRNIRAMLHAWEKYGYELAELEYRSKHQSKHRYPQSAEPNFSHVIKGKLNYMRMVCGAAHPTYIKLLKKFNQLSDQINHETINSKIQHSLWVIQNEDSCEQGTAFLLDGFGVVTCAHVLEGGSAIFAFRASEPNNTFPVIEIKSDKNTDLALIGMKLPPSAISLKADLEWQSEIGKKIVVAGYPNYLDGDQVFIDKGEVIQLRKLPSSNTPWTVVNAKIVAGNSGGPVLNKSNKVVGVVVTGSQGFSDTDQEKSIKHGFVPIELLQKLIPPSE
jgi:retron-type reverse transcriptase